MIPEYLKGILAEDAQAYTKRLAGWPYAGLNVEANRWAERKYHFAREIWPKRNEICQGFKDARGNPITWADRFAEMWHESLDDYRQRLRAAQPESSVA